MKELPQRSRPIRTGRPRPAKYPASSCKLQWVHGWTGFSGRVLAAATRFAMIAVMIRWGRPPARRGSSAARPLALNAWITSRTVSSPAATSRAIAGTSVPDAGAMMIIARRTRTDPCFPADNEGLAPHFRHEGGPRGLARSRLPER